VSDVSFPVQVELRDSTGQPAPVAGVAVTLAFAANPGGGTLRGATTATTTSQGVASFAALSIDKSASGYTLRATSSGLASATSAPFIVAAGPPARLFFAAQPTATGPGAPFAPSVSVAVVDSESNLVGSPVSVSLALGANPTGAVLGGTTTVATQNGTATFSNLTVDRNGSGYTLVASASNLPSVTSATFDVSVLARWVEVVPNGTAGSPPVRRGHSAAWDGKQLYVFGGFLFNNDVWRYDPGTARWSQIAVAGPRPAPRVHAGFIWTGSAFLLFGGATADFTSVLNDLWSFDPSTGAWTLLKAQGAAGSPSPRDRSGFVWV
jgi:hypothetical protein